MTQEKKINIQLVSNFTQAQTISNDIALFDDINRVPLFDYPNRMDCVMFALCTKGSMEVGANLQRYTFRKNQIGVMLPDQILQLFTKSPDFEGRFILLSRRFLDEARIDIQNTLNFFLFFKDNPVISLTSEELQTMNEYYRLIEQKISLENTQVSRKIIQHLLHAVFLEVHIYFSKKIGVKPIMKNRKEELFQRFMGELELHYRQERMIAFYADRLCLSPKYLSAAIKEISGKLASQWIDDCVILEAKTLLKSSNMSIQQIAQSLNFANQSFFGKYFKKHVGLSPKQYRSN